MFFKFPIFLKTLISQNFGFAGLDLRSFFLLDCICKILLTVFQKVDAKKLEKAEAKLQQKQAMRADLVTCRPAAPPVKLESATASQVTSKKEAKMEAKGTNRAQDVRIDNFDIAYGDKLVSFSE